MADPTLASARPDPRAGEDGEKRTFFVAGLIEQAERLRLYDSFCVAPSPLICGLIAALQEQEGRLRAAEAEVDAVRVTAMADAAALVCGYCTEGVSLTKALKHPVAPNRYNRCTAENIWRALARASQGDPATGTHSVPRPTEEERG